MTPAMAERTTTRARPRDREATLAEVCGLIATGLTLQDAAAEVGIDRRRVWEIVGASQEGRDAFRAALEAKAEIYAAEIVELADREDLAPDDKRVRVDARKWVASRLLPQRYGDRVQVDAKVQLVPALDLTLSGPTPRIIDVEAPDDGAADTGGAHPPRALRSEGA